MEGLNFHAHAYFAFLSPLKTKIGRTSKGVKSNKLTIRRSKIKIRRIKANCYIYEKSKGQFSSRKKKNMRKSIQ